MKTGDLLDKIKGINSQIIGDSTPAGAYATKE